MVCFFLHITYRNIVVEFSLLWYFLSKLEKLRYKYYNVIAIYMQNQLYHEIEDIEIYQISKLKKIKFRIIKLPKIEIKLVQIVQNLWFSMFLLSSVSLFIFHQNDFQTYVSNRSQCFKSHGMFGFAYKVQLHYNIYNLVFTIWMLKIIKMKIPLGSWKLYAKRNIPWEWAKWDLQNERCAKYTLEKGATLALMYHT